MVPKTCSIDGCGKKFRSRGLCASHYNNSRLTGQFETTPRTPTRTTCSFEGCTKKHLANGLCAAHYAQRKVGTALRPSKTLGMPDEERFDLYVDRSGDCWEWTGHKSRKGYASFYDSRAGRGVPAHRFAYERATGPIPEGAEVDHRCLNRGCVNPAHLRLATRKQNMENRAGASSSSQSGIRGVYFRQSTSKWVAYAASNGKTKYFGTFDSSEEADAAAIAGRLELFTHNELDRMGA